MVNNIEFWDIANYNGVGDSPTKCTNNLSDHKGALPPPPRMCQSHFRFRFTVFHVNQMAARMN